MIFFRLFVRGEAIWSHLQREDFFDENEFDSDHHIPISFKIMPEIT